VEKIFKLKKIKIQLKFKKLILNFFLNKKNH
jgi:hypothetical protein